MRYSTSADLWDDKSKGGGNTRTESFPLKIASFLIIMAAFDLRVEYLVLLAVSVPINLDTVNTSLQDMHEGDSSSAGKKKTRPLFFATGLNHERRARRDELSSRSWLSCSGEVLRSRW